MGLPGRGGVLFGLGVYRLLAGAAPDWPWFVLAAVGGPVLGALVGAVRRLDWNGAARAVDATYLLKDRAVTALWRSRRRVELIHCANCKWPTR